MPTLELSMIVKKRRPTLSRCLDSVRHIVNTITIGDTAPPTPLSQSPNATTPISSPSPGKTISPKLAMPSSNTPTPTGFFSSTPTKFSNPKPPT